MSGRTGRSAGNALGVLGLFFSSFESGLGYLADGRTSDAVNSVAAGNFRYKIPLPTCCHNNSWSFVFARSVVAKSVLLGPHVCISACVLHSCLCMPKCNPSVESHMP